MTRSTLISIRPNKPSSMHRVVFPFKNIRRNVTQMLPSMYPCVSPHAAAIERTYCVPLVQPPLLLSHPPLHGRVGQDHRCSQRSSWRRAAGEQWKPGRWNCDRTNCYGGRGTGKWGQGLAWISSVPLAAAELAFYGRRACGAESVHQVLEILYEWSSHAGNAWRLAFIWSCACPTKLTLFPAVSVYFGAADGRDAAQCAQADVCASCHPVRPVFVRVAPPGPLGVKYMLSTGVSVITG